MPIRGNPNIPRFGIQVLPIDIIHYIIYITIIITVETLYCYIIPDVAGAFLFRYFVWLRLLLLLYYN